MFQNEDPQEQCSGCKLMVRFLTRFVPPATAKHLSDAWLARKQITNQYLKQLVAQKLIQRLDMYYQTG